MLAAVFAGMASAPWNATSAALTASWAIGQGIWLATGDNLPLTVYVMCDIAVLAVIFLKPAAHVRFPYRDRFDQAKALLLEKSLSDRVVMLIFPVMWALYIAPVSDFTRWYFLWGLAIAQFLAAGAATAAGLKSFRGQRGKFPPPPWVFRMGWEKAGVG